MDRRFHRRAARAHIDALRSQREGRGQTAPVADAAAGQHRDGDLIRRRRDQHQSGNIVLAGMARTFETVDADDIDPHLLRRDGMAHRRAFVQHGDAMALEIVDMLARGLWPAVSTMVTPLSMIARRYSA
jgi:hypothetical protein